MSRTNFLDDINLSVSEPTNIYSEKSEHISADSNTESIIEGYENKTKIDPYNCDLLLEYSQFLVKNNFYSKAINILLKLIAIDNNHEECLRLLFYSYDHENKFYEAIKIGEQLGKIDENNHRLFYCLFELNFENGDIENALKYIKKSVEIDKDNDEYWKALAYLQSVIGNNKGACMAWRELLRINPKNDIAKLNLAIALSAKGQYEKANKLFSNINIKNEQSDFELNSFISYYLWNCIKLNLPTNDIEKIIQTYGLNGETTLYTDNNDVVTVVCEYLGDYFSKNIKFDESIKIYKKAYDISSCEELKNKITENYIKLSGKYISKRHIKEAVACLKEGMEFDPENETIQKIYRELKNKPRRKRFFIALAAVLAIFFMIGLIIVYYYKY